MTSRRRRPHYRSATVGYRASRWKARLPRQTGLRGFTCVRCCGSPRASIPHALAGKAAAEQCQLRPRAAASGFWLPPTGPIKDSHLRSSIHAQRTFGILPPLAVYAGSLGTGNPSLTGESSEPGRTRLAQRGPRSGMVTGNTSLTSVSRRRMSCARATRSGRDAARSLTSPRSCARS